MLTTLSILGLVVLVILSVFQGFMYIAGLAEEDFDKLYGDYLDICKKRQESTRL